MKLGVSSVPSPLPSAAFVARCDAWSLAVRNDRRRYTQSEPLSQAGLIFTLLVGSPDIQAQMLFMNTDCLVWYYWSLLKGGYSRRVGGQ